MNNHSESIKGCGHLKYNWNLIYKTKKYKTLALVMHGFVYLGVG